MSMRALWLDYQQPPPGRQWPGGVLLIASLVVTSLLLLQYRTVSQNLDATERKVALLKRQAERHHLLASNTDKASANADAGDVKQTGHTGAQWDALFTTLERAADDTITLLGLDPGAQEITITGEAKDFGAALDYARRLQSNATLAHVHLTEHEVLKDRPFKPLRFTLVANWLDARS